MHQEMLDNLAKAINEVAYQWASVLILPSTLLLRVPAGLKTCLLVHASGKTPFTQSNQPTAKRLQAFRTGVRACIWASCPLSLQPHRCLREMSTAAQFPVWSALPT